MFGLVSPAELTAKGIVGMNRRNVRYIAENNPRHLYPLVDDKLKTKELAIAGGIAVPKLLGVVSLTGQIKELPEFLKAHERFVFKPSHGSGGKGILVVVEHGEDQYTKPSGAKIGFQEVSRHMSNTLSGLFSLGGKPDVALIEAMVDFDDCFEGFSFEGVPDVRIIVYKGFPVMAMTRLSTSDSDGKANLHQGAVGVGLDIGSGKALRGVMYDRPIEAHPDTGARLADIAVPHWEKIIYLGARCAEVTGLGYLGADVVLDKQRGPLVLELNARPGLAIQVANGMGLKPRMDRIQAEIKAGADKWPAAERAEWSLREFRLAGTD